MPTDTNQHKTVEKTFLCFLFIYLIIFWDAFISLIYYFNEYLANLILLYGISIVIYFLKLMLFMLNDKFTLTSINNLFLNITFSHKLFENINNVKEMDGNRGKLL